MAEAYTVTGQVQGLDVTDPTGPVPIWTVSFKTTGTNVAGSVKVPVADYTAEEVNRRIMEQVQRINAVAGL